MCGLGEPWGGAGLVFNWGPPLFIWKGGIYRNGGFAPFEVESVLMLSLEAQLLTGQTLHSFGVGRSRVPVADGQF